MNFFILLIDDTVKTTDISSLGGYSFFHRRELIVHFRKYLGYVCY